ncbi:hypothetical protein BASA50_005418 [Batrachochytrium salamandrivorans]|uniref:VWFD domain-containing protein n=1 Tax=Batrachochytrium salamandrivorans TaxID=1357716 RepID=A0ABQ8FCX6_9FUNG|nr:hypothetical protein BASA50_005418 [Batrachochytrium salamandrivorans]KAH9273894.1 hypothetical protein BASA83_003889 [Batrachochytrium salamandrivorans]
MLSRLITTFLCAVAIGSVSGAFLAFDPDPISFEDIEAPNSFSVQLKSKPTEEVIVYFEHPFLPISDCVIVFDSNNWNAPRPMTIIPAPLFVGSSNPPRQLKSLSGLLAKSVTVGSLSAELPSVDTFKVIQRNIGASLCSIKNQKVETFDEIPFSFNKPGWYQLLSTRDIGVQVFVGECTAGLPCIKKVLARYGSSVMSLDVSGPVKNISEYSVTKVTQNDNGLRYTPVAKAGGHKIDFPYGSELYLKVLNNDGIVSLDVDPIIVAGYPSSGGLCNRPRYPSRNNRLIGPDGKLYSDEKKDEVAAFAKSWGVKDEDVLTNPRARTLIPPTQQLGTICKLPKNHRQNL